MKMLITLEQHSIFLSNFAYYKNVIHLIIIKTHVLGFTKIVFHKSESIVTLAYVVQGKLISCLVAKTYATLLCGSPRLGSMDLVLLSHYLREIFK